MIRFADLFSGCGGLSAGFYRHKQYKGVLAVDSWTRAGDVYCNNHPRVPIEELDLLDPGHAEATIQKLKGQCDVLLGGPPCQGFSTLGKRRDEDERSTLVDVFLAIALAIRPEVIVVENVPGIESKKHATGLSYGELVRKRLQEGVDNTRYRTVTLLINVIEYGLAQTRRRWFLVAVRTAPNRNKGADLGILERVQAQRTRARPTLRDVIGDLPHIEAGEGQEEMRVQENGNARIIYNHRAMRHTPKLVERLSYVPPGGGLPDVPKRLLTPHLRRLLDGKYGSGGHVKNVYGRMRWDEPSGTIVAGMDKITCGRFVHPQANRLLTPRECARIQSFPDSFQFQGSLVNQYYMIGNAVPPAISRVLANAIYDTVFS